ncbi:E3 ubiquitin-protein ligase RNF8 [Phytophthora citrophthora]|uniref:E3 ubiquitin-protein ligase CHFR n=1 Tax=Phytophthora citrophthora TaxID=4793 RepID=A0AAD9H0M2_9STRA|nr:E3 ubiquitin-protein ligase RNF8 [Phytophthora citrophthora]
MDSWEFGASFCVGRSRGCEVSITTSEETRTVSKRHVGFVPLTEALGNSSKRWLIYDLDTMNGTAVNGVEIPKGGNQELHDGDEVVLASSMRQCVRFLIQFSDTTRSRIIIKALARPMAPSPAPLHRRSTAQTPSPRRLPRRTVITNASAAATGFGRSAVTISGSPALTRTGCRPLVGTPNSDANMMTPPPQNLSQKRSRSSPSKSSMERENVEKNKQHSTPNSQQRKRSRRGGAIEEEAAAIEGESSIAAKRARENEKEERERLMMCPVCLDYFHSSATLPCSHTFCGFCISTWFRNSLSCPECRNIVKTMPVRNRALDELVERLVGQTDAYKSLVRRRARMQRRSIEPHRHECGSDEDESAGATRGVGSLQLGNNRISEPQMRSSVFTRWSVEEKLGFSGYINDQFGEARVASCRKVGLTEAAVDRANMTELLVAAQNLLLDCGSLRLVSDECCQRLKIFLFFG